MQYIRSFSIVITCFLLGQSIVHLIHLPIPGSIIGLFILFFSLTFGICRPEWGKASCHLLIKHMALLFIPIGVGLMNYADLLKQDGLIILTSTVGSTLIVLIVVGIALRSKEND